MRGSKKFDSNKALPKVYILNTVNTGKELLRTAIWANKKMGWFLADLLVYQVILKFWYIYHFAGHQTPFCVPEHKPTVYSAWDV
jgi:hypothetical protein